MSVVPVRHLLFIERTAEGRLESRMLLPSFPQNPTSAVSSFSGLSKSHTVCTSLHLLLKYRQDNGLDKQAGPFTDLIRFEPIKPPYLLY